MNDIKVFINPESGSIRTLEINREPYFVGKDVTEALGYSNTRKALADHVDEEDKGVKNLTPLEESNSQEFVENEDYTGGVPESTGQSVRWRTANRVSQSLTYRFGNQ